MAKVYLFSYELYLRSGEHKAVEVEAVDEATARIKAANMAPAGDLLSVDLIDCGDIPSVEQLIADEVAELQAATDDDFDGGAVLFCSVCGVESRFNAAIDAEWCPSWVDRSGRDRDPICPDCVELLGLEYEDDEGVLTFPEEKQEVRHDG